MQGVAAALHRTALLPTLHGCSSDAVLLSQLALSDRRLLDLLPHRRRGRGVLVLCAHHEAWVQEVNAGMTAFRSSRPRSRVRRFLLQPFIRGLTTSQCETKF
jgi:hypothetical protein